MKKEKIRKSFFALLVMALCLFSTTTVQSQVRAGGAFLKMNPGIRHHGMGFANAGALDDIHSFYTNPAATAYARDWEWATSYSKWFADTGIFSFVYANNLPKALDRKTKFALGLHYMDFGEFNSTYYSDIESVSAADVLFSLSLARPVSFLSPDFSLGANFKYFSSQLHDVTASSFIFDVGALYQFPRVNNFIFSVGGSLTQLGQPLNYLSVDTPLPRSSRFGLGANYHTKGSRIYLQLNADYVRTLDAIDAINVGGELNYDNTFYLRSGYQFNDNLLSRLTFGAGFRFNAGRKSDMRFDAALLEGNEIFSPPLQAGIHHFSVGPDPFYVYPTNDSTYFPADFITFRWDDSRNRDLYESFNYFIVLARDDARGFIKSLSKPQADDRQWLTDAQSNDDIFILSFGSNDDVLVNRKHKYSVHHSLFPDTLNYALGHYEWTVVAADANGLNYQVAENSERFEITLPDLQITVNEFRPNGSCANSDCCGDLDITIQNNRDIAARQFYIKFYESAKSVTELTDILADRQKISDELLASEPDGAPLIKINHLGRFGRIDTTIAWTRTPGSSVRSLIGVVDFDPEHDHWTSVLETDEFSNNLHVLELPFADLNVTLNPLPPIQHQNGLMSVNYLAVFTNRSSYPAENVSGDVETNFDVHSASPYLDENGTISIQSVAPFDSLVIPFSMHLPSFADSVVAGILVTTPMCDAAPFDNVAGDTLVLYDLSLHVGRLPSLRPKVTFESGLAGLSEQSKMLLDSLGQDLNALLSPTDIVRISGHTDTRGDEDYNLSISRLRAQVVDDYLKSRLDVPTVVAGFGEYHPQETDTTKDMRVVHKMNRRIELDIFSEDPGNLATTYSIDDRYKKPAVFGQHAIVDTVVVRNTSQQNAKAITLNLSAFEGLVGYSGPQGTLVKSGEHAASGDVLIDHLNADSSITLFYQKKIGKAPERGTRFLVSDTTSVLTDWDVDETNNIVVRELFVLPALPNLPPEALDVRLRGEPMVGDTLKSVYSYFDAEEDSLSYTIYRVKRGNDLVLTESRRGTTFSYPVQMEDAGSFISLTATPFAKSGRVQGLEKASLEQIGPIHYNEPPVVDSLRFVLNDNPSLDLAYASLDDVLEAVVHYSDREGDPIDEAKTKFEWSIKTPDGKIIQPDSDNFSGDKKHFVIKDNCRGNDVHLRVIPYDSVGRTPGTAGEIRLHIR